MAPATSDASESEPGLLRCEESEEHSLKRKKLEESSEMDMTTAEDITDEDRFPEDQRWQQDRRRRGRQPLRRQVDMERTQLQRTIITIRPAERRPVTAIPRATLHRIIKETAPDSKAADYATTQTNLQTNTIVVTTYSELHASNLCKVSQITVEGIGQMTLETRKVYGNNVSRGVILTDPNEYNDELKEVLRCEQGEILDVKQIGKSGRSIITFNTMLLPKHIKCYSELCRVSPYIPRLLICHRCHKKGHMQKYCPNEEVCSQCGTQHTMTECEAGSQHCVTCNEKGHLATDAKCPAKEQHLKDSRSKIERRSRSRSKRRTATSNQSPPKDEEFPWLPGSTEQLQKSVGFESAEVDYATIASSANAPSSTEILKKITAMRRVIDTSTKQLEVLLTQYALAQKQEQENQQHESPSPFPETQMEKAQIATTDSQERATERRIQGTQSKNTLQEQKHRPS